MDIVKFAIMVDTVVKRYGLEYTSRLTVEVRKDFSKTIGVYYTTKESLDKKEVAIELALLGCFKIEDTPHGLFVEVTDLIRLAEYYYNKIITIEFN